MKQRFSALDISATIAELQPKLQGLRLANVYDINGKTFLFKFQKPELKELLLVESGTRIHTTGYVRDKQSTPSGFNTKSCISYIGYESISKQDDYVVFISWEMIVELICNLEKGNLHTIYL